MRPHHAGELRDTFEGASAHAGRYEADPANSTWSGWRT